MSKPRPSWWRPLWVVNTALVFLVGLFLYLYQGAGAGAVLEGVALALVFLGGAYYVRVRPNVRVNRAVYLLLGFSPIGLALFIAEGLAMKPFIDMGTAPFPVPLVAMLLPFALGIFIGDRIGRRRNYELPMTP